MENEEVTTPTPQPVDAGAGTTPLTTPNNDPAPTPGDPNVDQNPAGDGNGGEKPDEKGTKTVSYDFQMPEGFALNAALTTELTPILSKFNVGKEEAQSLVNLHIKALQDQQKQIQDSWVAQEKTWLDAVGKDPELGDQQNQAVALQAVKQFATPELQTLLEETRLGSHPEMIRLFIKIGKSISEDSTVLGNAGNAQKMPRDEAGSPMLSFNSMK